MFDLSKDVTQSAICLRNAALVLCLTTIALIDGQTVNRPPQFVSGSGDMSRFSLSENTPVGSIVYQLKGKHFLLLSIYGINIYIISNVFYEYKTVLHTPSPI